ncbi:MAG: cytochrome c oxidase accessory protein CcoG, partial [Planctomycetota bacterium]
MSTASAPQDAANDDALIEAPEHVLSTLERDGSRRWLYPKLATGAWWNRRRTIAYVLMVVFVVIPHLRWGGKPLVLLDIAAREFTLFGRTFLPTDTLLLALLMLTVFVSIVLVTAIAGRLWCGWACPQTVYMEFLFRPIDRLFEGTVGKGGKPKRSLSVPLQLARFAVYVVLCGFLSHTFLAYFVGTERLAQWIFSSPIEHPIAFLVMSATLGLMIFDFMFFREQLCLIACPYGRFQSVMLDEQSMIVAYDTGRGEPRKKGKHLPTDNVGDCVDCNQCVVVCPTGIDIRDGLQMECINCTQCIDACDDVMEKVGSPKGLIRYGSQDGLAGKAKKLLRARTIVYPLILVVLMTGLVFAISTRNGFDARVIRHGGAP